MTKRFEDVVAVNNVSFEIHEGEFFSMLGPSGCGKTTTLRMIAGFEEPSDGRILLRGGDVTHVPPAKRHVNMVFQSYALFPHMSVFENVAFGLRVKRVSRDDVRTRVAQALRSVRLEGMEERKPGQLSGGQQQRVALARALVNEPPPCCSTSRSARSTSSCARRCSSSSRRSRRARARRSST